MLTNALGVMRAVEGLQDLVLADGLIGVMSSGQGSIANNEKGGHEVYRGSKAALNQYMGSYTARHADDRRALVLMAPGWIRVTTLGFKGAMLCGRVVDRNLDHPDFRPVFESASAPGMPILLHPRTPTAAVRSAYYSGFTAEIDAALAM